MTEPDENIAEETKIEDSNPFGEAVSSGRNSFTCGKQEHSRKSRPSILARPGSIFIPKESQVDENNQISDSEGEKVPNKTI